MRMLDPRLVRRARSARAMLVADVAIGFASAVLILVQATLLARVVSRAFSGAGLGAVWPALALLAAAFCLRGVLAWSFEVTGRRAAARVMSELRVALVERRMRAQPAALDGAEGGEITAAAVQGVDALEAYFARYLPAAVLACLVPVAVLAWVVPVDLTSGLIMLLTLPLVPVFMWLIGRYTERRTRERWLALRMLSGHFLDVLRGLPTLRSFNRGEAQAATVGAVGERYRAATMETLRVSFLSGSVLELAATIGVALVAVTVGVRLVDGGIAFSAALTVLILAPELYAPFRRLGAEYHASADGRAVAERILGWLEAPAEVKAPERARVAPSLAAATVRFEGVRFAYPARPGLVLDGLDLALAPGETVALSGESGAGKSTVAGLLLRLFDPLAGRMCAGDVDLAQCDARAWRRELAWVPQRPVLVRGTIEENVRLGCADASEARVWQALSLAGAAGFVRSLPDGARTLVGDGGRALSAGERRRIGLARAFVRDAPLVILDEPTADLDAGGAAVVADAVRRLCAGRTVLLISHDPALVALADRVLLLAHGRVADPVTAEAA